LIAFHLLAIVLPRELVRGEATVEVKLAVEDTRAPANVQVTAPSRDSKVGKCHSIEKFQDVDSTIQDSSDPIPDGSILVNSNVSKTRLP
jgi:hypothetical protein